MNAQRSKSRNYRGSLPGRKWCEQCDMYVPPMNHFHDGDPHHPDPSRRKAPKSQSQPSSSPDPYLDAPEPLEIVIEPNHQSHYWEIVVGSCRSRTKFIDSANPIRVSNYLRAKAQGPINVIWNL